jgi:hypothetical protein
VGSRGFEPHGQWRYLPAHKFNPANSLFLVLYALAGRDLLEVDERSPVDC